MEFVKRLLTRETFNNDIEELIAYITNISPDDLAVEIETLI